MSSAGRANSREGTRVLSNFGRLGGLAGVMAGVAYAIVGILNLVSPQEPIFLSFSDYLIELLFVVAWLGTLATIVGLHVSQSGSYGQLGAAGSLTAAIGYALLFVISVVNVFAGGEVLVLGIVFLVGLLAALVGLVLLGAATLRARVLPSWCGVLLIAVLPLAMVVNVIANAGGIVQGVVWALVGFALLSRGGAAAQQPMRVS